MIRAIHYQDRAAFEANRTPGSFWLEQRPDPRLYEFVYFCPCGCGTMGRLLVGEGHKPGGTRPSWNWNGDRQNPELFPSVNNVGHWHGWLRGGYWQVCT